MKNNIVVFTGRIARELLKKGFTIVDVKPNREQPLASVFIFKNEKGLEEEIKKLM